jgi:hypothetical protein
MKKTILALLSAVLVISVTQPAQAEDRKVLAIIDTAIDSSLFPQVIYEACFTSVASKSCLNKTDFMEGKGSANATAWPTKKTHSQPLANGTFHGDWMTRVAIKNNPNISIVFVRYSDIDKSGNSSNSSQALIKAIDWVSKNSEKYSIDAVSISQSGVYKNVNMSTKVVTLTIHPDCSNSNVISSVASLTKKNVPVFAATGNDELKTIVGFPACLPDVIGVGALSGNTDGGVNVGENKTNRGPGLDLITSGNISIVRSDGITVTLSGSSGANVVAASAYIYKNKFTNFTDYINSLPKEPVKFPDSFVTDSKSGNKTAL